MYYPAIPAGRSLAFLSAFLGAHRVLRLAIVPDNAAMAVPRFDFDFDACLLLSCIHVNYLWVAWAGFAWRLFCFLLWPGLDPTFS